MAAGFLVMPFLVGRLGLESYGIWILIGSLSGYFGLLDLGVATAVGRLVASYRAKEDIGAINRVISTATILLIGIMFLCAIATLIALWIFPRVFAIPQTLANDVSLAIAIVGLNLGISFPGYVFSAIIWGHSRFDLQSLIDVPATLLRTAATFVLLADQWKLTTLASITLTISVGSIVCKALICAKIEPRLKYRLSLFDKNYVREIYSFGIWMSLLGISRTLIPQIPLAIIGNQLSAAAVTSFVIARQLVAYANSLSITATQVMAPQAAALHALNDRAGQAKMFFLGGRYSTAIALTFAAATYLFCSPFLSLWQPLIPGTVFGLTVILMLGEVLPMSQWSTYSIIVGAKRHRLLAILALVEAVAVSVSVWLVLPIWGLVGVCVCLAVAGTLTRGLVPWLYGCYLLDASIGAYCLSVFARVSCAIVAPVILFLYVTKLVQPNSWPNLSVLAIAFVGLTSIFVLAIAMPKEIRAAAITAGKTRLLSVRKPP